ncbi:MAG TPA: hypothetical protein PLQ57_14850 [Saprospiraceae bacterium]|nr:hypothetical protein [Saprospiraceae bacterium]
MIRLKYILLLNLLFIGCDFSDNKLSFRNDSGNDIIVQVDFLKNSKANKEFCTRMYVPKGSKKSLSLLNRNWKYYNKKSDINSYLEFSIISISNEKSIYIENENLYADSILENGYFESIKLNFDKIDSQHWQIVYPF